MKGVESAKHTECYLEVQLVIIQDMTGNCIGSAKGFVVYSGADV